MRNTPSDSNESNDESRGQTPSNQENGDDRSAAHEIATVLAMVDRPIEQPCAHAFEELAEAFPKGLGEYPTDALPMHIGGKDMLLMFWEPNESSFDKLGQRVEVCLFLEDRKYARKTIFFFADGRMTEDPAIVPEWDLREGQEPDFSDHSNEDVARAMIDRIRQRMGEQTNPKRRSRLSTRDSR